MDTFGTFHLADNPALYEPARTNNFEFVVTDIDGIQRAGIKDGALVTDNDYINNAQEVLRVSVLSSTVPHFTSSVIDVKRGNSTMHFAGTPTFNDHTLVLNDYMGARTKSALLAWQALCYDVRTDRVPVATVYKKNCWLYEYSPDYKTIIRKWRMIGCWITGLDEPEFSNETNDKKTVTAKIIYDRAIPMLPDENE